MMKRRPVIIIFILTVIVALSGCGFPAQSDQAEASEVPVVQIPLSGSITKKKAELSGLAWFGDTLLLLPQYPEKFGPDEGALFVIPKQSILDYLDGKSRQPIVPSKVVLKAPGLKKSIPDYEGFEAIALWNQTIYMTIESGKDHAMMGYLVSGTLSPELTELVLDTTHVVEIEPAIQMDNRTDEAIFIKHDTIYTIFEVNAAELNSQPVAHVFGLDLTPQGTVHFQGLPYRLTDATAGTDGKIWVINSLSPGDTELFTSSDPLTEKYYNGTPAVEVHQVERLVQLDLSDSGIILADTPPIQIVLGGEARNWEGIVQLDDRGFLLVTDEHPDTIFGFVPMP
jgi:hypothetical protein